MATISAHFEGQTNGTAVSPTNSDDFGDSAIGSVTKTSTTVNYSTVTAAHGTTSIQIAGGLTASSNGYFSYLGLSAAATYAIQFYTYFTAYPSGNALIAYTRDGASATMDQFYVRADGTFGIGPNGLPIIWSSASLSLNTWYRWDISKIIAASAGKATLTVNTLDQTTNPFGVMGYTNNNTGTTTIASMVIGKPTTGSTWDTLYIDDVRATDTTSNVFSPYVPPSNVAPTVSISPSTYTATLGSPISVTGVASDTDGTIASRTWTCTSFPGSAPTLSGASTSTVTFTPATAGVYTLSFTATDNTGASPAAPATATVYVPAANVTVNANPSNTGTWTGSYTDLADNSDSTFVQSTGSGTDTFVFNPATPSTTAYITVRAAYVDAGATINWSLLQGSTTIASGTISGLTATPANYTLTLTSGQVASITDWTALKIAFS